MKGPAASPAPPDRAAQLTTDDELIVTGEAVALDVRPAGFVLRAASALIDGIALFIVAVSLAIAVSNVLGELLPEAMDSKQADSILQILVICMLVLCFVVLPMLVEWLSRGKSLGRLIMGLRIVRDDGGAAHLRHAFIRALTGFFEFFMSLGSIAILTGIVNARSKRVGDMLAGTYAQNERAPKLMPNTAPVPPGLEGWAAIADVARLPDPLARRVRDYLIQAPRLEPAMRQRLATALAREVRAWVHPLPQVDADTFLRAVSAVRRDREARGLQLRAERHARIEPQLQALPHGFPQRG